MPDNRPNGTGASVYLNAEDVRAFMLDRSAEDNPVDMDLSFSDEEIAAAMRRCARDYNSVPPFVNQVQGDRLFGDTNLFLYGTAKHLYLAAMQRLMRGDVDYQAGGVQTSINGKRIEHYNQLIKDLGEQFLQEASARKLNINIINAFGRVG
jgi:hypothetical protein